MDIVGSSIRLLDDKAPATSAFCTPSCYSYNTHLPTTFCCKALADELISLKNRLHIRNSVVISSDVSVFIITIS